MVKFIKRISKTAGHIPGELIHVGEKKIDEVKISVIDYDYKDFQENEKLSTMPSVHKTSWGKSYHSCYNA